MVELIVSIIYIATIVEPAGLLGIACLIIVIPLILVLTKKLGFNLGKMAMMRDNRSGKINEILNAIKVIKLFNLEPF